MRLRIPLDVLCPDWFMTLVKNHRRRYSQAEVIAFAMALLYGFSLHWTKKRKSLEPYFYHDLRGIAKLLCSGFDLVYVIAYAVHEFIEDNHWSQEDLAYIFGSRIGLLVFYLSKQPRELFARRKDRVLDYIRILSEGVRWDWGVAVIKLFDRYDNTHDVSALNDQEKERLFYETHFYYIPYFEESRQFIPRRFLKSYDRALRDVKTVCSAYFNAKLSVLG